jgi:hypothetical protein
MMSEGGYDFMACLPLSVFNGLREYLWGKLDGRDTMNYAGDIDITAFMRSSGRYLKISL